MIGRWSRRTKQVVIGVVITASFMTVVGGGYIYWNERQWQLERAELIDKVKLNEQKIQAFSTEKKQKVWVLAKSKVAGSRIHLSDLKQIEIPTTIVPKQVVEPKDLKGSIAKIDLAANVPLLDSMVGHESSIGQDIRWIETSVIQLPLALESHQVIDVRIRYPDGQDYVVLSHKKVQRMQGTTIWLHMSEHEMLTMSSACVDAYLNGGQIYAVRYVDAYVQERAIVNYPVNQHVMKLINNNPNLIKDANTMMSEQARKRLEGDLNKYRQVQSGSGNIADSGTLASTYETNHYSISNDGNRMGSNSSVLSPFTGQSKTPNREAPFVGQPEPIEQSEQINQQQHGLRAKEQENGNKKEEKKQIPTENSEFTTDSNMDANSTTNNVTPGVNQNHTSSYEDVLEKGDSYNPTATP